MIRSIFLTTSLALTAALVSATHAQTPAFSKLVVFGDSLSDVGNLRERISDEYFISYPSGDFNYSDGRFTNSSDTDPSSKKYVGVWHEQLSRAFLHQPAATPSLKGGTDYAFGGATTKNGTSDRTVFDNPFPFGGGRTSIAVDNMGRQLDNFLKDNAVDPAALYVVWGGGNDFFDDDSAANVTATSHQVVALVNRLIAAGAKYIMVPNVPPLGGIPLYGDDAAKQATLNQVSSDYRDQLNADLDANALLYSASNPPTVYRLDIWSLFIRFVADPASYGFTDMSHPAQDQSSVDPDTFLFWDDIHPTTAGHFQIAKEANRVLSSAVAPTAQAMNLSTRADVETGENVTIGGFIISGAEPKRVVLRGLGPSLTANGVQGALANPRIELFDSAGTSLALNDNWRDTQQAEIAATNLAPSNDLESAIVQTLAPGSYTVILSGVGSGGVGLIEIYDVATTTNSTLSNVSTRGLVGGGDAVLIGGVIVGPGDDAITVVRALGPSLTSAGVANPLLDPTLDLYDSNGTQLATNDDWRSTQLTAIEGTLLAPKDDRESAIVASLPPGEYTAIVRGKSIATGVALVEVYRIP